MQQAKGCHACTRTDCWRSCGDCPSRMPSHTGQKPRAFVNILHERSGGGSCWINAALQALLSPCVFKDALSTLWGNMPDAARDHLHGVTTKVRKVVNAGQLASPLLHEEWLAATFYCAHSGDRTKPFSPYLFTDAFYHGAQNDAAEFIARLLHPNQVPTLTEFLSGRLDQSLICTNPICHQSRPTEGENFSSLQLPLRDPSGNLVTTVQAALDAHMPDEAVHLDECCPMCQAETDLNFVKTHLVTQFPRVLILSLNRWAGVGATNAILHSIEANRVLVFKDHRYQLCAVVCHLGGSPNSGHYVTVARHPTHHGEWWLYDDWRRVIATDEQVSTVCTYRGSGAMQSYILLYERSDDRANV